MLIKLNNAICVAVTALMGLFAGVVLSENAYYR